MIYIRVDSSTARLEYALYLIFDLILQTPYKIISKENTPSEDFLVNNPVIYYTKQPSQEGITIPSSGLLHETIIRNSEAEFLSHSATPTQLFAVQNRSYTISYDLFATVFFLSTAYEKYMILHVDKHKRYDEDKYPSFQKGWYKKPWIHILSEALWNTLKKKFPTLNRKRVNPRLEITFDIDHPWKYKNKSIPIRVGGLMKDVFRRQKRSVRERWMGLILGIDPNDTFEDIVRHFPPSYTKFFFLVGGSHSNDSRYSLETPELQKIIHNLHQKGYLIGIHPSYMSFLNPGIIQAEINALSESLSTDITSSRQHFLRYRYPDTFKYLSLAGISHDYSLCMYRDCGFITGMAIPYPWFDLSTNTMTSLQLHPTIAMDTALRAYAKLTVTEALDRIKYIMEETKKVNGIATLLFHNELLSDSDPWEGWRAPFLTFFQEQLPLWDPV